MCIFGESVAHQELGMLLKTGGIRLESELHYRSWNFREPRVIVYALLAALLILVGVTFASSIDFSKTRRH
jgi:ABC-type Fe3+-siderophore transport system permease subunit